MGIAMDEYEAREREMGENPCLTRAEIKPDRKVFVDENTTITVPKTVNGRINVMLSCRCGATVIVPLRSVEDRRDGNHLDFKVPDGWYADGGFPYARNPDEAYIVRCPQHRGLAFPR
ncbi:hypothetical protein PBI_OAKER_89 [Mycobacterium phage Oaker]|uniref:hypothetical protein n=1 Tax=Mycobacterium phage Oaker TaxID=1445727 RepID=UPI0003E3E7AC|nr:hypothetical protein CH12_gp89 [Mycobacterium phage Oaker]AHG24480.1 hypothetical protein PBI_OAKER_89 [Mycobacterium phage Oaker]